MQRKIWRLRAALAAALAAALVAACLPAARAADVITFNEPALANLYPGFEEIALGDYRAYFQMDGGLIGTADDLPASTAPSGNATPFAMALNAGVFSLYRADGQPFDLLGFDFAYVPQPEAPPLARPLVLVIEGGSEDAGAWFLDTAGTSQPFVRYDAPSEMAAFRNVTGLTFIVCSYDPETNEVCTFTVGAGGQFALDNITLQSPVPEPTGAWLWGAGLAALGVRRRLQARQQARPQTHSQAADGACA